MPHSMQQWIFVDQTVDASANLADPTENEKFN